jgi:hypothetical protein
MHHVDLRIMLQGKRCGMCKHSRDHAIAANRHQN